MSKDLKNFVSLMKYLLAILASAIMQSSVYAQDTIIMDRLGFEIAFSKAFLGIMNYK